MIIQFCSFADESLVELTSGHGDHLSILMMSKRQRFLFLRISSRAKVKSVNDKLTSKWKDAELDLKLDLGLVLSAGQLQCGSVRG